MTISLLLLATVLAGLAATPALGSYALADPGAGVAALPRPARAVGRPRALVALVALLVLVASLGAAHVVPAHTSAGAEPAATVYRADSPRTGSLPGEMANVAAMVGATAAWHRGIDGSGIGVALVDSGITPVAGLAAPGAVIDGPDFTRDAGTPAAHVDAAGHGTHLAGIIAARPEAGAGAIGDFTGIAPGAHLVNLKARAADGSTDVAAVTAAVRWAVAHRDELNIRVLNLAFNTTNPSADLTAALDDAWSAGITVVVSAGNGGAQATSLTAPADDARLLSVGGSDPMGTASTADDVLGEFSSRGNAALQPSLVAPGRSIVSAAAPGSEAASVTTAQVAPGLMKGTGTSQASAVVSGAAALLLQQRPWLTPDQVKASLLASAAPLAHQVVGAGAGIVDVARALENPTPVFTATRPTPASFTGLGRRGAPQAWDSNSWGSNSWDSNSWGSNSWGSNSWGSNSWGSNSWGSNSWGSNSWGSNSWGSNSWGSNSWGSNSWGSNSWGSNSWGSNSWGSNSWGSNSWGSNSWGSNSWGSNSWGSNSWGSNSWGSNSWGSNSWG